MYCIHCGKQIENNSKFCPYCGNGNGVNVARNVDNNGVINESASKAIDKITYVENLSENTSGHLGESYCEINNKYAWALATVPTLTSWVIVWLFGIFGLDFAAIMTIVLNAVFLYLDIKMLENSGRKPEKWLWLGVVIVPLYLFVRASKTDKKYGYGIAWCVLFLINFIL